MNSPEFYNQWSSEPPKPKLHVLCHCSPQNCIAYRLIVKYYWFAKCSRHLFANSNAKGKLQSSGTDLYSCGLHYACMHNIVMELYTYHKKIIKLSSPLVCIRISLRLLSLSSICLCLMKFCGLSCCLCDLFTSS